MEENDILNQSFRNSLSTIDKKGKRKWIYAKKPKGKLWFWRNLVGFSLLTFFFFTPFIQIKGSPMLLFNFFERKFIIFGIIFWPQDSYIFFLMMITFIVFIILFTVIYGRIFCGWMCPQTIFLELIFRRIEYWIEGDMAKRIKLNNQPWNAEKMLKRGSKLLLFAIISIIIINTLISYLVGIEGLKSFYRAGPSVHPKGFIAMSVFSFLFFGIYSWFREQVCIIACPYGRMQGVLLDSKSIVVSYDYTRGEPKAPYRKTEDRKAEGKGDCVNCMACVHVCPTGIDIRNGTQLECVNCTACIDACNSTMKRVGLPTGLIRYASSNMISKSEKFKFTPRIIAYSFVLLALLTFLGYLLSSRTPLEASIVRTPGMLYQEQEQDQISNLYNLKVINKTRKDMPVEIRLLSHEGKVVVASGELLAKKQEKAESVVFLYLKKSDLTKEKVKVQFGIFSEGKLIQEINTWFLGPNIN